MHSWTLPRPNPPLQADDPFRDLLESLEAEETHTVPRDDRHELRQLFDETPRRRVPTGSAPPGSPWPEHNYGAAYQGLRRDRRVRPGPRVLAESDLWDVDQLTHEAPPEPAPASADAIPWRTPTPRADPTGWLDTLDAPAPRAEMTEARMIDLVWGRPLDTTLFEVTEVLRARARRPAAPAMATTPKTRFFPRSLEVAGLAVLLMFALAVLQLLLS